MTTQVVLPCHVFRMNWICFLGRISSGLWYHIIAIAQFSIIGFLLFAFSGSEFLLNWAGWNYKKKTTDVSVETENVLRFCAEMSRRIRQSSVGMVRGWSGAVEMWEADSVGPRLLPNLKGLFCIVVLVSLRFEEYSWFNRPHFHSLLPRSLNATPRISWRRVFLLVFALQALFEGCVIDIVVWNNGSV